MKIHRVHDLSDEYVIRLLETGLGSMPDSSLTSNYSPKFKHDPANLFYILQQGRYKTGVYFVIEDEGKYICSAGWNKYDDTTALVLTRAYISPEYRTQYLMASTLLPTMIEETIQFEKTWITCNKTNSMLYQWFVRAAEGKRTTLFNDWPEIYKKFKPIGEKEIYYTAQLVVQLER